jgi:hypothetical protein
MRENPFCGFFMVTLPNFDVFLFRSDTPKALAKL